MIDDTMPPVYVPWDTQAEAALKDLEAEWADTRVLMRRLQSYAVPIPNQVRMDWIAKKILMPVRRDFGDRVLRLPDLAYYHDASGLDLSDNAYRKSEENVW